MSAFGNDTFQVSPEAEELKLGRPGLELFSAVGEVLGAAGGAVRVLCSAGVRPCPAPGLLWRCKCGSCSLAHL